MLTLANLSSFVFDCMFRRKPANAYQDRKEVAKKGDAVDKALSALPRDKVMSK